MRRFQEVLFLRRLLAQAHKIEAMIGSDERLSIRRRGLRQACPAAAAEDISARRDKSAAATDVRQGSAASPAEGISSRVAMIAGHDGATSLAALISAIYSLQVALIAMCNSSAVVFFRM